MTLLFLVTTAIFDIILKGN